MEMGERNQHARDRQHLGSAGGGGGGGAPDADLSAARADAQRFYEASRAAIARGLSQDSQAFLDANRQEGGQ